MMKVSTLFLHGGETSENNSLNYHTLLAQYTNWPSVKKKESLTNSNSKNLLLVNSRNVSGIISGKVNCIYRNILRFKNVYNQNMYFSVRHVNSFNNLIVWAAKIL